VLTGLKNVTVKNKENKMIQIIVLVLIGIIIGWSVPKPQTTIITTITTKVSALIAKIKAKFAKKTDTTPPTQQ
jgi:hypothetical protein